jgi:hypothetical protein
MRKKEHKRTPPWFDDEDDSGRSIHVHQCPPGLLTPDETVVFMDGKWQWWADHDNGCWYPITYCPRCGEKMEPL